MNDGDLTEEGVRLSVGQVAERAGVKVSTLHFYEQQGLIQSKRNQGNQRRYSSLVLRKIGIIKTAQRLGIALSEIKEALDTLPSNRTPTKADWTRLSKAWRKKLEERINHLEKLKNQLDSCIGCGCLSMKSCRLRNPDDVAAGEGEGAVYLENP